MGSKSGSSNSLSCVVRGRMCGILTGVLVISVVTHILILTMVLQQQVVTQQELIGAIRDEKILDDFQGPQGKVDLISADESKQDQPQAGSNSRKGNLLERIVGNRPKFNGVRTTPTSTIGVTPLPVGGFEGDVARNIEVAPVENIQQKVVQNAPGQNGGVDQGRVVQNEPGKLVQNGSVVISGGAVPQVNGAQAVQQSVNANSQLLYQGDTVGHKLNESQPVLPMQPPNVQIQQQKMSQNGSQAINRLIQNNVQGIAQNGHIPADIPSVSTNNSLNASNSNIQLNSNISHVLQGNNITNQRINNGSMKVTPKEVLPTGVVIPNGRRRGYPRRVNEVEMLRKLLPGQKIDIEHAGDRKVVLNLDILKKQILSPEEKVPDSNSSVIGANQLAPIPKDLLEEYHQLKATRSPLVHGEHQATTPKPNIVEAVEFNVMHDKADELWEADDDLDMEQLWVHKKAVKPPTKKKL